MIGPGTGVSPFVGFLQHRAALLSQNPVLRGSLGKAWLLFGCRNPRLDHIYGKEMEHFQSATCLTRYHVAYSRLDPSQEAELVSTLSQDEATPPTCSNKDRSMTSHDQTSPTHNDHPSYPRYVQDLVRLNWREIGSWLVEDKCYVYVCG